MAAQILLLHGNTYPSAIFEIGLNIPAGPERKLIREVLFRAINDAIGAPGKDSVGSQSNKREAREWLFMEENITPFSFYWICDHLDLCPEFVRKRCKQLIKIRKSATMCKRSSD